MTRSHDVTCKWFPFEKEEVVVYRMSDHPEVRIELSARRMAISLSPAVAIALACDLIEVARAAMEE